jgi:hypothetical protein
MTSLAIGQYRRSFSWDTICEDGSVEFHTHILREFIRAAPILDNCLCAKVVVPLRQFDVMTLPL